MADEKTFTANMRGGLAAEMTLGGVDLLRSTSIREVDLYLRAGQVPEVVIRPVVDKLHVDIEGGEGKEPRYILAPDIGVILTELGWMSPEAVDTVHATLAETHSRATSLVDELAAKEAELETAAGIVDRTEALALQRKTELETVTSELAQFQEDLTNAQGTIQDLELANATLHAELEATKATQDRLTHPYATTSTT